MMKKFFGALLVVGLCVSPISILADEGDANQQELPSEPQTIGETDPYAGQKIPDIGNITQVDNLYNGFYVPLNQPVTVTYQVESDDELNGQMIDPQHIVSQKVWWNGKCVLSYSNGSHYDGGFTPTTIGSGYIETTWDNGNTEEDGIATLLFVIVNYYDMDTKETLRKWQYIALENKSFYNGNHGTYDGNSPEKWDASNLEKVDIDGYQRVDSDNIIGNIASVHTEGFSTGDYAYASVFYKKEFTVTYTDGVDNEEVFADQSTKALRNDATPAFGGEPKRDGYKFMGWSPEVAKTVTEDATYAAQWEKIEPTKDDEKSEDTKKSNGVPTGVENRLGVYICMMGIALTGMTAVFVEKKKKI